MTRPTTGPAQFDVNQTNAAPPTTGRISDGYGTSGPLPSSDLNYLFGDHGRWLQWLASEYVLETVAVALPSGTTNDFDVFAGSFSNKSIIQLTGGGPFATVSGIVSTGAEEGRAVWLVNETAYPVTFLIESTSSSAANRIDAASTVAGGSLIIAPKGSVLIVYSDPPTGRWAVRSVYGQQRYRSADWRAGFGDSAQAANYQGFQSTGASWAMFSGVQGESGEQCNSLDVWISSLSGSLTLELYRCTYAGTLVLEHSWTPSGLTSGAGFGTTFTPSGQSNQYTGWLVKASGNLVDMLILGVRVGFTRT